LPINSFHGISRESEKYMSEDTTTPVTPVTPEVPATEPTTPATPAA
jgi:hypothetical protein